MDSIEPMQVDDPDGPPDAPAGFTVEPPENFVSVQHYRCVYFCVTSMY